MADVLTALLEPLGLGAWKQAMLDNSTTLVVALAALFLVPLLLGLMPNLGAPVLKPFLDPEKFQDLPLVERKDISHNTRWFRFALPEDDMPVGLPVGQHISLRMFNADGKEVVRSYTPTSGEDQLGFIDFVIKIYPQGELTPLLDKLKLGDKVGFLGPKGRMDYKPNMKRHIGMIAGGTGITPMYQVMKAILRDPKDKTNISLIVGNVTEDDILLREELDEMVASNPGRVSVYHVLNKPPSGWTGGEGFVTESIIKEHCPAPADDVMIWRCGPPPMNVAVKKCLESLGYSKEAQFQF